MGYLRFVLSVLSSYVMKKTFISLLSVSLVACAAPSVPYTYVTKGLVKPATNKMVEDCEYLDDLVGTSGWYGVFATQGIENARNEILIKAANIGATHIVWQFPSVGYGSTSVVGKSYRCID
jgi:hypothetical protein